MQGWVRFLLPVVVIVMWTGGCGSGARLPLSAGDDAKGGADVGSSARMVGGASLAATMDGDAQACCFEDDTCADMDPMDCMDAGGFPRGMGSTCDDTDCSMHEDIMACCFEDDSCEDMDPMDCMDAGGRPQGMGSTCDTTDCEHDCGHGDHHGGHGGHGG